MRRFVFAIWVGLGLYGASVAIGFLALATVRPSDNGVLLAMFGPPAIACIALWGLLWAIPGLCPSDRMVWPLNVTVPLLHCALLSIVVSLSATAGPSIERVPVLLVPSLMWLDWRALAHTCVLEVAVLSLPMVLRMHPTADRGHSDEPR